ncbi:MAG: ATP-dependent DNA helicase RecG [Bacteroidales bacterium]|nr:ATP-dependent DNA helicase RecG [Bacteroidales bacterium]
MTQLKSDIQYLPGVGPKRAQLLKTELEVATFGDLIHLYPFRYIDRSSIQRIAEITPDVAHVQVMARVIRATLYGPGSSIFIQRSQAGTEIDNCPKDKTGAKTLRFNAVKRLSVIVADSTGEMEMVFFKGIKWNWERLTPGSVFVFFGKPQTFGSRMNIVHPEVDNPPSPGEVHTGIGTLTGVYPSTEKLKNAGITGKVMNRLQAAALNACLPEIEETLPEYILHEKELVPLKFAMRNIHFPQDADALLKASYRLKFEELFFLQLSLLKQKYIRSRSEIGIRMPKVGESFNALYRKLPFDLTGAQKRVIKEIRADLTSGHQMNRLLQGDVGSGKTMVAVLTCLIAYGNGFQSCIMAPTEVLSQQHYANVSRYLEGTGVRCALLTGSSTAKERREIHAGLEDGSIAILIGTHALIEDDVRFRALGLAIIDEQHRFGVDQRSKLWAKGPRASTIGGILSPETVAARGLVNGGTASEAKRWDERSEVSGERNPSDPTIPPHVLVMTATPIPRTLAMTLYGDLDVSVIDELPPGRKPVQTMLIGQGKRRALYKFMRDEIAKGRQVFVVFPLIFESEKMDLKNLEAGYEEIVKAFPLPDYKVAIVHGQQTNEVKNYNMSAFAAGRADILVSTTVIEVGVDVPNASVMVIESAQRFGLSQLHQLRGRVGRGSEKSYCILVKDEKVSKESQRRLDLMVATENGFELAEEDMKMRGPGDLEGTQQSGLPIALNIASLVHDSRILNEARVYAEHILESDPFLSSPKNLPLARELQKDKYNIKDYSKIS